MKTLTALFFLMPAFACAQAFNTSPFLKVQASAAKDNKILMVLLYAPICTQCNEVADKGLSSAEVQNRLDKNEFITVAYRKDQKDWADLKQKFNASTENTSLLFISPQGNLLHKSEGSTTFGRSYIGHMDRAVNNIKDEQAYLDFEKAYQSGSRNPQLLEQLLSFRMQMGKGYGDVLDDYARALPSDSLQSLNQLQKIARSAPELGSYADSILRANQDRFNEAWYRMTLQERVNINNRIISKTKASAIANKDRNKIMRVADFSFSITGDFYQKRRMPRMIYMDYYKATGDTTNYITTATMLMETLVMKVSPDSIKRADLARKEKIAQDQMQVTPEIPGFNGPVSGQRSFTFIPATQYYANDLNSVAFEFYKMTSNKENLEKALRWSARSLEFNEAPALHDTYARLLYKTGSRDSAIAHQQIAIDLEKKKGFNATEFEKVLVRMKSGEAKIDEY
jgi:tetratricopeptide (TPR) repeat protein